MSAQVRLAYRYGESVEKRSDITLYIVGAVIALASVIGSLVAVAKLLEDR